MPNVRKGRVSTRFTAKAHGRDKHKPPVEMVSHEILPITCEEPCAMAGASLGFKSTKNYQGVDIHVSVTLPVRPDLASVKAGVDLALKICDEKLGEQAEFVADALDQLARDA